MITTRDENDQTVDSIGLAWNSDADNWGLRLRIGAGEEIRFSPAESQRLYEFLANKMANGGFEWRC
jgi:hypothetical protein